LKSSDISTKNKKTEEETMPFLKFKFSKKAFFHSTTLLKPIHTHNEDGSLKKARHKNPFFFCSIWELQRRR
jgi:hypothetical protein